MTTVISATDIGKRYNLRHSSRERHDTIRDSVAGSVLSLFGRLGQGARAAKEQSHEEFWALQDVSFSVAQGERVGIIGRNGAGKSTLLKILSRIVEPTTGEARIQGRVASLLEVGTGFHPELTGRENIFLNGAILGMTRSEIARRFSDIVSFAEVERFLDTPVKRYSSGMYVRLAFSVAAHLEPDILIVDEVLAVGDAQFQKKCIGKMENVSLQEGRTVLFVSHNLNAIVKFCDKCILLDQGRISAIGASSEVVKKYLEVGACTSERVWSDPSTAPGDDVVRLRSVRVIDPDGANSSSFDIQKPLHVVVEIWNHKDGARLVPNLHFYNEMGVHLFTTAFNHRADSVPLAGGLHRMTCAVPGNFLADGRVSVTVNVSTIDPVHRLHLSEQDVVMFKIDDTGGVRGNYQLGWPGVVRPQLDWEMECLK